NLEGADFSQVKGLSDGVRASLCSRPTQELGTWNPFTRSNTAQSLGC
ncbi:MAG TPA: pentapeptide repeat-containing protein, partial [Cyanobacteria bacterium UBA11159]|nr:pentapeptide repeat-containing protein [Cyanobacteria bacterium UBA11159]